MKVTLPWPPSTNRLWRSPNSGPLRGRLLLSREGRAFKESVLLLLADHPEGPLPGRVGVRLVAHPPDRRRRDLDNLCKAVLDSLKGHLFGDDADIDHLEISRGEIEKPGSVEVSVWRL